ncbi:hypothetical protein F2Q68_00006459 [Brassica cretica]|uniref:Arginine decarboxylase n=1 Tax=Brassica cretica TaxID=69181 RepID=A0A8S9JJ38_BRACR|nr:hypothetical protein F2Q68_00006459 [Brassica cretica]
MAQAHQVNHDDIRILLECDEARATYEDLYAVVMRGDQESCLMYVEKQNQRCVDGFKDGVLSIEQLASVDGLCEWVLKAIGASDPMQTYNINLSVFTSIPDLWGIDQLFPIVPIHKLDQRPVAHGTAVEEGNFWGCSLDGITRRLSVEFTICLAGDVPLGSAPGKTDMHGLIMGSSEDICSLFDSYLPNHEASTHEIAWIMFSTQLWISSKKNQIKRSSYVTVMPFTNQVIFSSREFRPPEKLEMTNLISDEPTTNSIMPKGVSAGQGVSELMFQSLKHRAEKVMHTKGYGEDENDEELNNVVACLDCSFNNMPYLATKHASMSNSLSAAISNLGFYYSDEDGFDYLSG